MHIALYGSQTRLIFFTLISAVDLRYLRIPGVLQRLALSYFGVAILQTAFAKATDTHQVTLQGKKRVIAFSGASEHALLYLKTT